MEKRWRDKRTNQRCVACKPQPLSGTLPRPSYPATDPTDDDEPDQRVRPWKNNAPLPKPAPQAAADLDVSTRRERVQHAGDGACTPVTSAPLLPLNCTCHVCQRDSNRSSMPTRLSFDAHRSQPILKIQSRPFRSFARTDSLGPYILCRIMDHHTSLTPTYR